MIKKSGFKYVAVSRKRTYDDSFWSGEESEKIALSDGKTILSMKLARTEEEVFLLCHSEAKESAILLRREEKFEQELLAMREGLKEKRKLKKYDKIMERIGRFKERYKVGNLYTIRDVLKTHVRVTTTMNTEDGHVIDARTCTTPTEKQHTIYNKLHIKHTPLGRKYMKSSVKTQRCSAEN